MPVCGGPINGNNQETTCSGCFKSRMMAKSIVGLFNYYLISRCRVQLSTIDIRTVQMIKVH